MSKSKQSIVCLVILFAMPLMALAQRGGRAAAPTVSSISPASATAGGAGFVLAVAGASFTYGSVVRWNGANLTTTYVSNSQLQASIPSALVSVAGTAQITVYTSGRGGGTSNGLAFTISAPATETAPPASTTTTTTTTTTTPSPTPLAITTTSVPAGTAGSAYSTALAASGGAPPHNWAKTSGALPPGLTLSAAGAISGNPTSAGSYAFTAQVTDSASQTATYTYSMTVGAATTPPLAVSTAAVPGGTAGTAYSTNLAATGGTSPYAWSVASGSTLPPGLAVSAAGTISGTPTTAATYAFSVQVKDSANNTATKSYSLTVAAATTTTSTGPVFQDGFESGGFSAWSTPRWVTINSDPRFAHSGAYSTEIHYELCGDSSNAACGASHQDANQYVEKDFNSGNGFPNGLDHFFLRGYVYLKSPEPGGSKDIQRKLFYLMSPSTPTHTTYDWAALLDTFATSSTGHLPNVTLTVVNDVAGVAARQFYSNALLNYDQWYSVEIELQANTPDVANGAARIWVNGTKVIEETGLVFRSNGYSMGITRMLIGDQADRTDYLVVDEYRYWDDIVVSLTGPIGP